MNSYYTDERNAQILISLMKSHNIRRIIASPGSANIFMVASLQQDSYFDIYSSVDERSAAYMACGLAAESDEPVALCCTGATASRNYLPGLTEAFYRKLPVLAITATQHTGLVGNLVAQVIDRSTPLNDIVKLSVQIPTIHNADDEWAYSVMINKAILELKHHGGGPVHINLTTTYSWNFNVKELPPVQVIERIIYGEPLPDLNIHRVGIFVGAHKAWTQNLTRIVDEFCEHYNGVVLCDATGNYKGKYGIPMAFHEQYSSSCRTLDVLIHIGEISGTYMGAYTKQVWRISPDGEVRDTFRKLRYVFEMTEELFFETYINKDMVNQKNTSYYEQWQSERSKIIDKIPELPFSNAWMAWCTISRLPKSSVLHLGILNSLRSWSYFELPNSVLAYSNTGGFGIDGGVSSLLGASLADTNKICIGVMGDLAFFYDMNSLGNRHVTNNLRLLLINNGVGAEFRIYNSNAAQFGDDTDTYIAAAGHYASKSPNLVRHYAEDLGFEYLTASTKEGYLENMKRFLIPQITEHPILFEVFTDYKDDTDAIRTLQTLEISTSDTVKNMARDILGEKGIKTLKKIIKR